MNSCGIKHHTSSPNYLQSNGFSERMVQTVKHVLSKSSDPYMAMLCLRATPVAHNLPSPCELLNKRRYQTNLPAAGTRSDGETCEKLQDRQQQQKQRYDQHTRELPPLVKEQPVRMLRDGKWEPAQVIGHADAPRSYNVQTPGENGAVYRRNRRHLRHSDDSITQRGSAPTSPAENSIPSTAPQPDAPSAPPASPAPSSVTPRRSQRTRTEPSRFRDFIK